MPSRSSNCKRVFAGGWLSDADASIMALIWQLGGPEDVADGPGRFEAEVIRGVDKIALLSGHSVDELKTALAAQFSSSGDEAPAVDPEPTSAPTD
jgi:hypothetical protein